MLACATTYLVLYMNGLCCWRRVVCHKHWGPWFLNIWAWCIGGGVGICIISLSSSSSSEVSSCCICGRKTGTTLLVSVRTFVRVPSLMAHGKPRAESKNPTSCWSGEGSRRIDRAVTAPVSVRTTIASSIFVVLTKMPSNHRGLPLLMDFTFCNLPMTISPNCTIEGMYPLPHIPGTTL